MGSAASIPANHADVNKSTVQELYDISCKLVSIDQNMLQDAQGHTIEMQQLGDNFILQANQLDSSVMPLESNVDLEDVISKESVLLTSIKEQVQASAKAKLFCAAALLAFQASHLYAQSIPFIEAILARNVASMNALKELCPNSNASEEGMQQAYVKFVDLETDKSAYQEAEERCKHYLRYSMLCGEKSKLVFQCANNPDEFATSSEQLKDLNSLLSIQM
jgi:hypothetical protein